jgi:hypothetical protein
MQRRLVSVVAVAFLCAVATSAFARKHSASTLDANGNGVVVSHKTGATARVGYAFASRFQGYIDDLESRGAAVHFMGGIRRGHCWSGGMHPCGKALDVCQTGRGRVDSRCHLPSRQELGRIAEAHGLFEGGRWCHSDYGHAQIGESAAPCGSRPSATMTASARSHRTRYAAVQFTPSDRLTAH